MHQISLQRLKHLDGLVGKVCMFIRFNPGIQCLNLALCILPLLCLKLASHYCLFEMCVFIILDDTDLGKSCTQI